MVLFAERMHYILYTQAFLLTPGQERQRLDGKVEEGPLFLVPFKPLSSNRERPLDSTGVSMPCSLNLRQKKIFGQRVSTVFSSLRFVRCSEVFQFRRRMVHLPNAVSLLASTPKGSILPRNLGWRMHCFPKRAGYSLETIVRRKRQQNLHRYSR